MRRPGPRRHLAHRRPGDRQLSGGAHRRRPGARARAGADDDQHGAAPSRHPRGAATAGQPRGGGGPRPEAGDGLRPHRNREELRGQVLLEGDPVRGADGLPLLLLQHGGVRRLRGAAARAGDPAAGQVPASDPPGAEPDPLAPRLARHRGARPRRDVDVLLLLPRPRPDPRPVRAVDRAADAHPLLPGRRRLRGHPASASSARRAPSAPRCPRGSTSTRRSSTATRSSCERTKNVGVVPRQRLLDLGVTGPLLRAAGEPWDLRKVDPILAYADFDFQIPVGTVGDGYDRYRVRVQEMRESVRIIEQALDGLPEGPWIADDRKVVLPPRDELVDLDGGA